MEDPLIGAAAGGLFRFVSEKQAQAKLDHIARNYLRSKEQDSGVRLWIRGFAVTPEEEHEGYRGHFARITIAAIDGGRFALRAEKIPTALAKHPQKERPKERHPNHGHPILRSAETGKQYASITTARNALTVLHEEFPDVTIPGKDLLHVMVYNRKQPETPIEKTIVHIVPLENGKARLALKKPKAKKPKPKDKPEEGKFTAMLKQRSSKKKK